MSNLILHVDADAFFVSCELNKYPTLKSKPVATGKERGVISSLNYLAKKWGVKRGMPIWQAKKACPQLEVLEAKADNYLKYSARMYSIIKQRSDLVEKYSVDECFALITSTLVASQIKNDLEKQLGISFSLGLAKTKSLAKIASKLEKPAGFVIIDESNREEILRRVNIEDVWGIGKQTSLGLKNLGIYKASQFLSLDFNYLQKKLAKNYLEIYLELQGQSVYHLINQTDSPKSLSRTKTFYPNTNNISFLLSQLSLNLEKACYTLRSLNLVSRHVHFFLKDSNLNYYQYQFRLNQATNFPNEMIREIEKYFHLIYSQELNYRATGVLLSDLKEKNDSLSLFSNLEKTARLEKIFQVSDILDKRFGSNSLFLASSLKSVSSQAKIEKDLSLPFLGSLID